MRYVEFKFGLASKDVHFIAANGYPPAAYVSLFHSINDVHVRSFLLRPINPDFTKLELNSWFDFVDDLHEYVLKFQPKIVMGHSIGAVLWLMYSQKYNYKFEKIILIDPALFLPHIVFIFNIFRFFNLHEKVHPLITPTLKRQRTFATKKEIFKKYRSKNIFKYIPDTILQEYIDSLFVYDNGVFKLSYCPKWEAKIYERGLIEDNLTWKYLKQSQAEINLIWAEYSNICSSKIESKFKSLCRTINCFEIKNATHLLPLEKPVELAKIINQIVDN